MAVRAHQYPLAECYREKALEYCEDRDLTSWRLCVLTCSAYSKFEQGDWVGCSSDVDIVLKHPDATPVVRIPMLILLGQLRIRRGDPDPDSPLAEASALAGPDLKHQAALCVARAEAAWLADERQELVRVVRSVYDRARQKSDPRITGQLATWLLRASALDGVPLNLCDGPYSLEIGGHWREAARAWRQLGCPYEEATLLALHGSETDKREALACFERLGASAAARALRKQFRAEGVKGVPRGARPSTQSNPHGLTRREAEVLALLSDGLRNSVIAKKLFVSSKTVDHHVSSILMKLGVPSRAEAVTLTRKASSKPAMGC
jgi:DNA-binding CsgD family transcriptional regulator